MTVAFSYPIFGPSIPCPHCRQTIAALTLTDTYLCPRHGAFEADPEQEELVHLQSGRRWRLWEGRWYRQHTHPDGIRFEIHEELDRLRLQGMRATPTRDPRVALAPPASTACRSASALSSPKVRADPPSAGE